MKSIVVAASTINQTPLDWLGNERRLRELLHNARNLGVGVVCLPELCISGYGCEDMFLHAGTSNESCAALYRLLPDTKGLVVSFGLPLFYDGSCYNCNLLAADGKIVGVVAKRYLANDGVHYEPRWFKAWPLGVQSKITLHGEEIPFGDLLFEVGGVRIAYEVCEEAWVKNRPAESFSRLGIDIVLNPSASHFAFGKFDKRKRIVEEGSKHIRGVYLYSNLLGNEAGRIVYDGGPLIAQSGKIIAQGARLGYADSYITSVELLLPPKIQSLDGAPERARSGSVEIEHEYPTGTKLSAPAPVNSWEQSSFIKEEEFARTVSLGLFDYLRKSRAQGFVVSLSGGADSSAVCCLVSLMVHLGLKELGNANFIERINSLRLVGLSSEREIVGALLTAVYQSSKFSGAVTRQSAETLANTIGASFHEWSIADAVDFYSKTVERVLGRGLTWKDNDVELQNIQARVRAPGVWLIANIQRALLLATSNRSEASVGYATMDGDTAGSLAPIAGIDKAYLRRWLVWLEKEGPLGFRPIPELALVNAQEPTAELRPAQAGQTDEKDLMPYAVLDAIERLFLVEKRTPQEIKLIIADRFSSVDEADSERYVSKFFKLWSKNQWKRERFAPSFHLDDESVDPRSWCRFPILSGGFEKELLNE